MLKKSLSTFLLSSRAQIYHLQKASFALYKPLSDYQSALGTLTRIFPQEELDEYEQTLKIYSSRSNTDQFSQEEATTIFPALFTIGRAHLENTKNVNEGLKWFDHALMFGDKVESSGNLTFAMHYQEMNTIFGKEKRLSEAIKCAEKAIAIYNSTELDADQIFYKLGCLYQKALYERERNDLNAAAQSLVEFLTILKGLNDPQDAENLISAYELLVNILYQLRNWEKTIEYAKRALELIDQSLGKDDYRGEVLARELSCTLLEQNRRSEGLVYVKKWENMLRKEYAATDPNMVMCYFLYGQLLWETGQYASALEKFEQAEKVALTNTHVKFADSGAVYIYKARCHFHLENFKEAQENFEKSIKYNTERFGPKSKQLADDYYGGAKIFEASEEHHTQAVKLYAKSLEMYRNLGQDGIFETWSTLVNFAGFLNAKGMNEESVKRAEEALEICKKSFPNDLIKFESTHNILGMAQMSSGELEASLENLKNAAKYCENLQDSSGKLVSHYFNLLQAYSRTDQNEQAEIYGRKILEMAGKGTNWAEWTLECLEPVFLNLNKQKEFQKLQKTYL